MCSVVSDNLNQSKELLEHQMYSLAQVYELWRVHDRSLRDLVFERKKRLEYQVFLLGVPGVH